MAEANETLVDKNVSSNSSRSGTDSSESLHPLVELTATRVREFLREKEAVFWVFIFPVLMTFALGIAFRNTAPDKTPVAIEATADARANEVAQMLSASPDVTATVMTPDEAATALRSGKVSIVVRPQTESVDYRFDPTRPESRTARLIVDDALQRGKGRSDVVKIGEEKITEPGARYVDFLVPGLLGMNLMGTGMWGLGFSLVVARNGNLLKRLIAAPVKRSQLLGAQLSSRLLFLIPEAGALLLFAYFVLDVPMRGSVLLLTVVALIGALAFAGLGLLTAARPRTIEGVSGLMNLVMVPMWIFSGIFFSTERFPDAMQPFVQGLPLTALIDALRAVMLDGSGLVAIASELLILGAWGLVSFALALKFFRWQ